MSTYKTDKGRLKNVADDLLVEILSAWETWEGTAYSFYKAIGSNHKSFASLLGKDPYSGHIFVFVNRRRTACKCLFYDGTGFVIVAKRLDKGRFTKFNPRYRRQMIFTQSEFGLFMEGAAMNKRFIEGPPSNR